MTSKAQEAADKWNAKNPVGTDVEYIDAMGGVLSSKTRSEAQVLASGHAVIWLDCKPGCVALSHVIRREIR